MTSSGIQTRRPELVERLSSVMQASRTLRSELALTICESSDMRLASRQLRLASQQLRLDRPRIPWGGAERSQRLQTPKRPTIHGIADAIAQILSRQGYSVFVSEPPQDTASMQ
jgi:hypothetical protein